MAGNLAWQAQAFGAAANLHRKNQFARLSWDYQGWSPAFDVLYMPEDKGRIVTASLAWQGDRLRVEGGWRAAYGPANAVARQLPAQEQVMVATWAL